MNTFRLHYKDQLVDSVEGNNRCLWCASYEVLTHFIISPFSLKRILKTVLHNLVPLS